MCDGRLSYILSYSNEFHAPNTTLKDIAKSFLLGIDNKVKTKYNQIMRILYDTLCGHYTWE